MVPGAETARDKWEEVRAERGSTACKALRASGRTWAFTQREAGALEVLSRGGT